MCYLAKSSVLESYKVLSRIDTENQRQGLTQKVSALKYASALDMFYKFYSHDCDLKINNEKNFYSSCVGKVVKINEQECTKNFYLNISSNGSDYDCGSNFYSQSSVKDSKTNPAATFQYPKRSGWEPVMDIKNQVLIYRPEYLKKSISFYLISPEYRLSFIVWLLRFEYIEDDSFDGLKNALNQLFTEDFCDSLCSGIDNVKSIPIKFHSEMCELTKNDFLKLFQVDSTTTSNNMCSTLEIINNDIRSYLAALRTKPFMLLAGISGTGKSRIVRKLAQASVTEELQKLYDPQSVSNGFNRWDLHKPANFELIQVKPNWHNSLEVVGYKSNIGGTHYEFTPFVEFIARAWKHQDVPFFLCLDEMNLAPVEQYFAEFLSAIESRSIENNEYETDPIIKPFIEFGDDLWKPMVNHLLNDDKAIDALSGSLTASLVERFKTKGLTLPQNLLVLGTVNMDETTFSFSRKVLDRAMSVVMNDVDYEIFFNGESENDVPELDEVTKHLLIERPIRGLGIEDNGSDDVKEYLSKVNAILEGTPFKLGYRAANEALLYVSASHRLNPESNHKDALDEFTLMKILSRVEGDKRSIGTLLDELKTVITADYPRAYDKLDKMSKTLADKQFVSYWT